MSVVVVIANQQIRRHGGDAALGAMGIITSFGMLFLMPIFGLNQGAQPIVGYNFGARRYDRVRETLKYTVSIAAIVCTAGWLLVQIAPGLIIRLFTRSAELEEVTRNAMRLFVLLMPVVGPQILCTVFFQAIGQAKKALMLSMLRQVFLLIPMYLILPRHLGLTGVWLAGPATDCLSFGITFWVFLTNIRRLGSDILPETEKSGPAEQDKAIDEFTQDVAAVQTAPLPSQSARLFAPKAEEIGEDE